MLRYSKRNRFAGKTIDTKKDIDMKQVQDDITTNINPDSVAHELMCTLETLDVSSRVRDAVECVILELHGAGGLPNFARGYVLLETAWPHSIDSGAEIVLVRKERLCGGICLLFPEKSDWVYLRRWMSSEMPPFGEPWVFPWPGTDSGITYFWLGELEAWH